MVCHIPTRWLYVRPPRRITKVTLAAVRKLRIHQLLVWSKLIRAHTGMRSDEIVNSGNLAPKHDYGLFNDWIPVGTHWPSNVAEGWSMALICLP